MSPRKPGQKMVGDITYIPTWEGWVYLTTVIDCYTKSCIGYAMADHLRAELVIDALSSRTSRHSTVRATHQSTNERHGGQRRMSTFSASRSAMAR
ncbi:MAG: DDE-type integrase/transposase/recombinase [Pseudonocardiaceae bacterium]